MVTDGLALELERYRDSARFAEVARRHENALSWEPQGWIPLGVIVNDPANMRGLTYDRWLEPRPFFEVQLRILRDTLAVGSDTMPVLPLNHLGDVLIPSMFGAELFVPREMADSLQDTGATPLPVFSDIREVDGLRLPDLSAGLMPEVAEIARAWRAWAPEWVHVVTPFPVGPFTLAAELRGSGFLRDILDDPERSRRLLRTCAEIQVRTERHLREAIGDAEGANLSNFGVCSRGRRLGDDFIISLSPAHVAEFAVPYTELVARQLGPSTVHFCTLPDRRADHVFPPLAASEWISTASSQFAFEYYERHVAELRGRLSIEALYGEGHSYVCGKYGAFRDWAFEFVPRFKDTSGLVLYFEVPSVEAGREVWATWQEAHCK
jgi:hypothetical protein